jgi:protoheme IX farnesyltransferase
MQNGSGHPVVVCLLPWVQLVKVPLCLLVAVSASFGAILHTPVLTIGFWGTFCGVFFLACGAAGFNSLQERSVDSLFVRTSHRPLVTGRLAVRAALVFSSLLVVVGLCTLFWGSKGRQPFLLGLVAIVLYNGVYTPLKGVSVFALFPGGLAGAIPPLIGWTSAGGLLSDSPAWALFALFFLWQIPHFCLILLQYQHDYHTVDRPALIRIFSEQRLKRITFVWMCAFTVVAFSLTLYPDLLAPGARLVIALMAGAMTILGILFVVRKNVLPYRYVFISFNSVLLLSMLMVITAQLIH